MGQQPPATVQLPSGQLVPKRTKTSSSLTSQNMPGRGQGLSVLGGSGLRSGLIYPFGRQAFSRRPGAGFPAVRLVRGPASESLPKNFAAACCDQPGSTLPSMSDESGLNEDLVAEVESMLRDGTVEGLARRLRRDFPALAAEADAAIGHGVEKLIVRSSAPTGLSAPTLPPARTTR